MDRLDGLEAIVAVADSGGFAAAARRLRASPVAVTRAVARLEDELGVAIFLRTTRSVRVTESGRFFVESCRRILADLLEARSVARGREAELTGVLTVAAPLVFGRLHVLPVVEALLARHPALDVRLTLSDRTVSLVEERVDVAVRIGHLPDSSLAAVRVGSVRPVLAASPSYLARKGVPADLAALCEHDLIVFEGLNPTDAWRFGERGDERVRVRSRLTVDSADAAVAAAERGVGIARALSYQVEGGVRAGRLALVLGAHDPAPLPISIVYTSARAGSANVKTFLAACREGLGVREPSPARRPEPSVDLQ